MGNNVTAQTESPGIPDNAPQGEIKQAGSIEPFLGIKKTDKNTELYSIELRDVELTDFFRVIAHDYQLNILVDKDIKGKVYASLTNISIEDAMQEIAHMNNIQIEKRGNVLVVKPYLDSKVFFLNHIKAEELLNAGQSTEGQGGTSQARAASATIYDLLSVSGKVLLGRTPNSLMVIDYPDNLEQIEKYLKMVDWGMESRIFKLDYLKAGDIAGQKSSSSSAEAQTAGGTPAESMNLPVP